MTYAQYIYATPEEWGNVTVYGDETAMDETIKSLIDAGGEEWNGISREDCSEWTFEGIPDLSKPDVYVYGNFSGRHAQFARFTADTKGYYQALEFFPTLAAANEIN